MLSADLWNDALFSEEFHWRPSIHFSKYGCSWLELLWNYLAFHPLHVVMQDFCWYLAIQYLFPNSLRSFRILFRFIMRFINLKFTFRMSNMNFEVIHLRAAVHTLRLLNEDVWKKHECMPTYFYYFRKYFLPLWGNDWTVSLKAEMKFNILKLALKKQYELNHIFDIGLQVSGNSLLI